MMIRTQLKDREYFDKALTFYSSVIEKRIAGLDGLNDEGKAGSSFDIWDYGFRLVVVRYSRGDVIGDMRDSVLQVQELLALQRSIFASIQLQKDVRQMYERLDLGRLYESLTLLAFMASLRFSVQDTRGALDLIGHAGEDALLDRVARVLGDESRPVAAQSKFPKIYGPLVEIIEVPAEQRADKLKKYVEGWYKRMKPIYWHDSHEGGAEGAYFGYWCFEAALVAMLFDVDDSAISAHPHYPADLVRHYRSLG
ncbi:DUF1911 domain-containing protein [Methylomonas montana]|uniref:PoNi-like cognate immunity protein n=1 Tax=Methylomonas montana TaxID=3058963 RepID=UPI002659DDBF|nr:PoNi-like cognate immunity protein [Methylomonas montana]WKJ90892.1 DUF1911 domain-containing protein [Methylomonas montana]